MLGSGNPFRPYNQTENRNYDYAMIHCSSSFQYIEQCDVHVGPKFAP